jgi:hypothetical protein
MLRRRARAEHYRDRTLNARLGAALLAVEAWLTRVKLEDADIRDLIEHLRAWPTIDGGSFAEWSAWSNDVLEAGLGGDLPPRLREACLSAEVREQDLVQIVRDLVELVYAHLYGALDDDQSMRDLRSLEVTLSRYGVELPSPSPLGDDR